VPHLFELLLVISESMNAEEGVEFFIMCSFDVLCDKNLCQFIKNIFGYLFRRVVIYLYISVTCSVFAFVPRCALN
jgi:hypothetical protein